MKILYNTGSEFKESKESTYKMMVKVAEDNGNIVEKSVQELVSNSFYDIKRLIGTEDPSDANSSVRAIARNELAKQLVPENASDTLDTLQEIADWIQDHPGDASQMNSRIDALEEAVPFVLYIQNGVYGYKKENGDFVPFKSQADIDAAVSAAMVGTATAADVLSGKTFTNSSNSRVSGSMPARTNGTSATGSGIDGTGPWVYMPYGYYPEYSGNAGNSYIYMTAAQAVNACPKQEKTVTAGTSAASVTPDSGKLLSKVTYNPMPSQEKSCTPSTSAQTISPDSGKLLSKVSVKAISPQRSLGTAATGSGIDNTGPYVYLPYGWYPYRSASANPYIYMTAAQAVAACPKQEKSPTSSRSAQTITPDSGKLLSKVSIAKYPDASGNYTCGSNNGAASSNDMGATNNYRFVNATAVYNKGVSDGKIAGISSPAFAAVDAVSDDDNVRLSLTNGSYYLILGMGIETYSDRFGIDSISIHSGATNIKSFNYRALGGVGAMMIIKATSSAVEFVVSARSLRLNNKSVSFKICAIKLF